MKRTWVVVALVVIASTVGAGAQPDGSDCPVDVEESGEPGQELANVVGAQESVVAREIERRGFNATLENASSPGERATVVATELERIDVRLTDLENCQEALVTAREEGDLTAEEYRQRTSTLEPKIEDVRERLNRTAEAADELPRQMRERNDIGEQRFENLTKRAEDIEAFVDRPERAIESTDRDQAADREGENTPSAKPTPASETPEEEEEETPEPTTTTTEEPTETPDPTTASQSDVGGGDDMKETPRAGGDIGTGANFG